METMVITFAQYFTDWATGENLGIKAVINGEGCSVPLDPANRHYQAILEWVADGNTIQDADLE